MTATPKQQYEVHPLAEIFPSIEGPAFDALVKDIEARDQQEHAWIYESKILDGKNRYEACKKLGRELKVHFYTGDDPVGFVLSANLHRRQLDTSQRAMVAAGLANLKVGTNRFTKKVGPSIEVAAQLLNVGRASVERAKIVLGSGDTAYTFSLIRDAKDGYARLRLDLTPNMLQAFLEDPSWPKASKYRDTKNNGWSFFPLQESREAWDRRYSPRKWNDVKEWRDLYLNEGSIMDLTLG